MLLHVQAAEAYRESDHGDSSYLGKSDAFEQAIASFAEVYADQNELDYATLVQAVETGRIEAQTGL